MSAASSRPVSPLSLNGSHTLSPSVSRRRISRQLSFSSLREQDQSLGSPLLTAHAHAHGKPDGEHAGGMGRRWVRWMHKHGLKRWVVPCAVLASVWVKWSIGLGSYSGQWQGVSSTRPGAHMVATQDRVRRQCMVTTRRSGIGWNSRYTYRYESGTHMTYHIGGSTTRP